MTIAIKEITANYIKSIVRYDPLTGEFFYFWQDEPTNLYCPIRETRADFKNSSGRCFVTILGRPIQAHRVAWIIMNGQWPTHTVDHRDTNPSNNIWNNLREATQSQQLYNRQKLSQYATSAHKGVWYDRKRRKWAAQICVDGKRYHLGRFPREMEAVTAYKEAASKLHGEFYRP